MTGALDPKPSGAMLCVGFGVSPVSQSITLPSVMAVASIVLSGESATPLICTFGANTRANAPDIASQA